MTFIGWFLMIKDKKGDDCNVVIVNSYEPFERDQAFAALKTLQSLTNGSCEAWLEAESTPDEIDELHEKLNRRHR